jgi:hypothetical protein
MTSPKRAAPVDPLLALGAALDAATANYQAISGLEFDVAFKKVAAIVERIAASPAVTIEGLRVKAKALSWCHAFEPIDLTAQFGDTADVRVITSIVRDLLDPHSSAASS